MSVGVSLDQQWARIRGRLKEEVGEIAYRSWLQPLSVASLVGGEVCIVVPTRFMRDWVLTHYADRIRALWSGENPEVQSIDVIVASTNPPAALVADNDDRDDGRDGGRDDGRDLGRAAPPPRGFESRAADSRGADSRPAPRPLPPSSAEPAPSTVYTSASYGGASDESPNAVPAILEDRSDLSAALDPRFTFENFVVGKPNELAHAAARRVADATTVTFNPLFLYGGVGLGKTHLMHALAWQIRKNDPNRKVLYLSAEKFMYQFIRALRFKDTMAFKQQFRSVDVLMIDDVQFISGKDSTQEEFFHTFNALVDQNRQVIISADKSPSDLEGMEERLRSRLGWGLVADIHPTTYELRLGILQAKADALQASIPLKVLEFLAHKITSNVRELEGALNRIVAHAELVGRSISLETTQEVLHDLLRANDRRVTIDEIQKRVAEHYNIRVADMHSARRARAVARPRQIAMYLAKQLTARSLPEIGRKFGGRDHTTVMHAVKKVDELRATDPSFAEDVELLRRMLES
ncbi:chromosomal replication initiator protein DnaA [Azospirillum oryzae]|uniref:Chromosomal replication initiator protein DnaA n=1 Tax=Azospirillum oryzae TaxID=286727 RepID=A0A6N1AGE2_9PROT|nr:chromosomal replication initiator protein DnaA [Azospirillum oryzae]KAA0584609.1 chromosomal replication initiator protein DnaA [Azospirillum oryzae]QKS50761.1 chromosomal replication initiator protein DnaA [Azospirillum oryzae]GLR82331.1 chromosomal replication initiator protein DnaA [Azospirillum oryzae]